MSGLQPSSSIKPPVHVRAKIISDVLEGSRLEHGDNGFVARRTMVVTDIPGSGTAILHNAMIARGVPYWGQSHPTIIGLPVRHRVATLEPGSQSKVRIEIVYEYPSGSSNLYVNDPDDLTAGAASIEISNTVQGSKTERDYEGNDIVVPRHEYQDSEGKEMVAPAGVREVEYQLPATIIRYRRRERNSPGNKSRLYTGKINAFSNLNPDGSGKTFTDPPHYWMCTGITGLSDDGGLTYNVNYEFQHNADTWDVLLGPRGPNGEPIPNAPKITKQIYKEIDFWALDLMVA